MSVCLWDWTAVQVIPDASVGGSNQVQHANPEIPWRFLSVVCIQWLDIVVCFDLGNPSSLSHLFSTENLFKNPQNAYSFAEYS